jgi:hypothetical protein
MRTRQQTTGSTSVTAIADYWRTLNGGTPFLRDATGNWQETISFEEIVDDDSKGRRFKAVHHNKYASTRFSGNNDVLTINGNQVYVSTGDHTLFDTFGYGQGHFMSTANILASWPVTDEALIRSTLDAFYNENEVDTLLNVVEAPQMVDSTRSLYQKIIGAKNVGFLSRKRLMKLMQSSGRAELSFLSGGYLYYKFGVAPIVSDMNKISNSVSTYKSKLESVIRKAGQEITVHRSCQGTIGLNPNNLPGYPDYGTSNDTGKFWTVNGIYPVNQPKKICTIRGIRSHQYNSRSFQTLDNLIKRFGSSGPASFLWERIPFSFVVDWFLDLSGVLNYLDNTLTGSTKKVTDACISHSWGAVCRIDKLRYAPNVVSNYDNTQIAVVELKSYQRNPIQPTVSVGLSGRFGKNQVGITAALIGQMAANLKGKR